jgi:hypothetical protein
MVLNNDEMTKTVARCRQSGERNPTFLLNGDRDCQTQLDFGTFAMSHGVGTIRCIPPTNLRRATPRGKSQSKANPAPRRQESGKGVAPHFSEAAPSCPLFLLRGSRSVDVSGATAHILYRQVRVR